jgi:hypothetical protein
LRSCWVNVFGRAVRWRLVLERAKPVQHGLQEGLVVEVVGGVVVVLATYMESAFAVAV